MPLTVSDGALVVHGDKLGTEQACCCPKCRCDLVCPEFAGAQVTVTGTRLGTLSATIPNADPNYATSVAPLCDVRPFGGGRQIIWSFDYTDTHTVANIAFNVVCGSEYGLAPGEYFVTVTALIGTPPDDSSIIRLVTYDKIYTDCDGNGLPVIDTANMDQLQCSDGDGNPLAPCPVRIQAQLVLA
jgi:hypothetical protein